MIPRLFIHARFVALVCILLGALAPFAAAPALAQEGHAWFAVDSPGGEGGGTGASGAAKTSIVHLPPHDRMMARGSIRVVQGLTRAPERLAWSASTLFILMPGERVAENEVARRVYSISAAPGLVSGWEYIPASRPETLPTLGGRWGARDMDVVGFGATPLAPVVLMRDGGGGYILLRLGTTGWAEVGLPWSGGGAVVEAPGSGDRCRLITAGGTFGILVERAGSERAEWCVGTAPRATAEMEPVDRSAYEWTVRDVVSNPPEEAERGGGGDIICSIEKQLVRVSLHGSSATLSILRESDEYLVTTVTGLGSDTRVAPVEGNPGFVAILTGISSAAAGAGGVSGGDVAEPGGAGASAKRAEVSYRLVEVTPGNRVLYDGPAKQGGPVSAREIQLLTVLLVMVMGAVVLFVLRPDKRTAAAIVLPSGVAPAESGRRILATVLDLGASWVVASMVARIDMADVARPEILFSTSRGWIAVGSAIGLTIVLGVVLESQFGLTIGKLLLGCRVVALAPARVAGEDEGSGLEGAEVGASDGEAGGGGKVKAEPSLKSPTVMAALVRNVGKWTPWNVMEFVVTGRQRHWADRRAKTVVVIPAPSDQEAGE